jgi:hypothetical protein
VAYKEKECRKCGVKHNKRGEYCSRSCGNSRQQTQEHRNKLSEVKREWINSDTDTAEEARWRINNHDSPEPVIPPTKAPLQSNQFVQDGDIWTAD